ncbi:MAG: aldose 1-epimerase family protein [Clostridiales bacterium]|jgi:galactose mutarotase-like enzyme|nr:aldose 1-epimerase family protein [Clostridiales bacterium]
MADICLENEYLRITASSLGGELRSVVSKKSSREYLWNGDKRYWEDRAPILFPVVGRLSNGRYKLGETEYELPIHGFARFLEYKADLLDNTVRYSAGSNEDTLKVYPYRFELEIMHSLDDNTVRTALSVKNTNTEDMYFSIGGHPGIMCPFNPGEDFSDYYLEFEKNERAGRMEYDMGSECFTGRSAPFLKDEDTIHLSYKLFENDAVTLTGLRSKTVRLKSRKSLDYVSFDFSGFPVLAFWTRGPGAGYLCIEPWFGYGAVCGFDGDFTEKPGIVRLPAGEVFRCGYGIEVWE